MATKAPSALRPEAPFLLFGAEVVMDAVALADVLEADWLEVRDADELLLLLLLADEAEELEDALEALELEAEALLDREDALLAVEVTMVLTPVAPEMEKLFEKLMFDVLDWSMVSKL